MRYVNNDHDSRYSVESLSDSVAFGPTTFGLLVRCSTNCTTESTANKIQLVIVGVGYY